MSDVLFWVEPHEGGYHAYTMHPQYFIATDAPTLDELLTKILDAISLQAQTFESVTLKFKLADTK